MGGSQFPLKTPCFVVDEGALLRNLGILQEVAAASGAKILLAQKAFSMFSLYPMMRPTLSGTTASGLYEAKLGFEEFGGETHVFSPAYGEEEFQALLSYCDHVVFNSCAQLRRFGERAKKAGKQVGLRINPACSTQEGHTLYDPCAPGSRLGCTIENFDSSLLPLLDGLHFHTLCQQNADALEQTLQVAEEQFGAFFSQMKWLNFGGGHHITREDYNRELLISLALRTAQRYGVQVYLEPGEAVVLNAGSLMTHVRDLVHNGIDIAILDTSAACHMPDVLEMPYRPPLLGSGQPGEKPHTYRLAGPTCLAGDIIGDYSFDLPLQEGDLLEFQDMALYTMVKTNTFNGMPLPGLAKRTVSGELVTVKEFGYDEFKRRLS